jgi:hypothetical protein
MLIPIIQIDSGEARNVDVSLTLSRIYYQPIGYQRNAKKLYEASLKAEHDITLDEVHDWLERQAVHQIHKPRPRYTVFLEQVFALLPPLIKFTRQMFSTCLMIK